MIISVIAIYLEQDYLFQYLFSRSEDFVGNKPRFARTRAP